MEKNGATAKQTRMGANDNDLDGVAVKMMVNVPTATKMSGQRHLVLMFDRFQIIKTSHAQTSDVVKALRRNIDGNWWRNRRGVLIIKLITS